ncbi:siphovirus Gp157 family protein [Myxosarcina sp. GI1]|uniref:siphovirus Gp157 family protein n=1 Tax=Myxosarcina sp. GI1 TaxID=1541065 RepID=UPI00056AD02A|nr:siphovirus Gp157 family protein [Myxosarcina sp. GI1]
MNLLDLNSELQQLNELIDSVSSSFIPPELEVAFEDLLNRKDETEAAYFDKIDNIAALIQSRKYWIGVRQKELKRLSRLIRSDRHNLNWLQSYLLAHLQNKEMNKLRTKRFNLTVADNGGKRPMIIDDIPPSSVPHELCKIRLEVDRDAVRHALESGRRLRFARLASQGKHLRIK